MRDHLRAGLAEAPAHARALLARLRAAAAAIEADGGGTLDEAMIEAVRQRLEAIEATRLATAGAGPEPLPSTTIRRR